MFCTECGAKNAAENRFCKQCGHKFEKAAERVSEEAYNRALPEDEQVRELLERAYALRHEGDTLAAIQACEQALQIHPDSASAHSMLAQFYALQGDRDRAIREYERVLLLNPGSIADRVKLDELRDEGRPKPKFVPVTSPVHHPTAPVSAWNMVSLGAAGLALLITGGILALQLRPRADSSLRPVSNPPINTVAQTSANTPSSGDSTGTGTNRAANAPLETASAGTAGTSATNSNITNPATPFRTVNPAPPAVASNTTPDLSALALPKDAPPVKTKKNAETPSKKPTPDTKDDRVVLHNGEDKGDEGHYTIRISTTGSESKGAPAPSRNSVRIAPNNGNGENAPGSDAQAAIAIGDDLRMKGDFDRSIKAYQRALTAAGDKLGYVYQQMAFCFQSRGDRNSAKVNYERAISEYQKMIDAGKNVEITQNRIRACRSGIKICS